MLRFPSGKQGDLLEVENAVGQCGWMPPVASTVTQ
jgi:hypothetical protein